VTYFHGFGPALGGDDLPLEGSKPQDAGGDCLPFEHLDGRRLEVLAYRIKSADGAELEHRVALMQGSGERGRDVVVRDGSGRVVQIVQCKNLQDRLAEPIARTELLKVALHAFLEPTILGDGPVVYELWCPSGFTEPAACFVDSWPNLWTDESLKPLAERLFDKYVAFYDLSWETVCDFVLLNFPKIVRAKRREGVDITVSVRRHVEICESFFESRIVMDRADVLSAIQQAVAASTTAAFEKISDRDSAHLLDRIASFPAEKRLVGTTGYVMGLPLELVSQFRQSEYLEYAKCSMHATSGITIVVQNACARIARELVDDLRQKLRPKNQSLFLVILKTLTWSMLAKVNALPMPSLRKLQPGLEKYREASLDERLEDHVGEVWDEYRRCIEAYDAEKHPGGSDEDIRAEIARDALEGVSSKDQFEAALKADLLRFHPEIQAVFGRFMQLIPDELLVITDTVTVFQKKMLFQRMLETTNELTRLRGSAIIPE
jgi:hypothetical protein